MKRILVFALACLVSSSAFAVTDSGSEGSTPAGRVPELDGTGDAGLTTQFAEDNNFAGNSFDVAASQQITIAGFDLNLDNVDYPEFTIDVYYRTGTAQGYESSAAGWTLLGSQVVTAAGVNVPSHADIGGLTIEAGSTIGFLIHAQEASTAPLGGFMYTNGGPNTYSDSYLDITTYAGISDFPGGSVFSPRSWNGTVYYWYGTALDRSTWGSIKVGY